MAFEDYLVHSCTIYKKVPSMMVFYQSLTDPFKEGDKLTCGDYDEDGVFVSAWSGTIGTLNDTEDTAGSMLVLSPSSQTINGNTLKGSESGEAVISNYYTYIDGNGQPDIRETSVTCKCRIFRRMPYRQPGIANSSGNGSFVVPLQVSLLKTADFTIENGIIDPRAYRLETSEPGYSGSYSFQDIHPTNDGSGIHHYEANIVRVA